MQTCDKTKRGSVPERATLRTECERAGKAEGVVESWVEAEVLAGRLSAIEGERILLKRLGREIKRLGKKAGC